MTNESPGMLSKNVPITVQEVKTLARGRVRVKIAEKDLSFKGMLLNGKMRPVLSSQGRGRFVLGPEA